MSGIVKERPILFSGPMVNAILADRKTQTRRIVNPQPTCDPTGAHLSHDGWAWCRGECSSDEGCDVVGVLRDCPYGVPGDRLWVRETFREPGSAMLVSGKMPSKGMLFNSEVVFRADDDTQDGPWRPAIFMPRWASRLTLEVEAVRVERLNEISDADVDAEGLPPEPWYRVNGGPRKWYRTLWTEINDERAQWTSNPFVWVVTFKRVDA